MTGKPTERQAAASMRNWRIRNLRALYALAYQVSSERRAIIQGAIDDELASLGADTDAQHRVKVAERCERARAADHGDEFDEVAF